MKRLLLAYAGLLLIGSAWGSSTPMVKIATEAGYQATGIMMVQSWLTVIVIGGFLALSGQWRRVPTDRAHIRLYLVVGVVGMTFPHLASLIATQHLPAGVMSIVMSLVPLFVLPISLAIGLEQVRFRRIAGVLLGAMAIILLIAPDASLPGTGLWVWVLFGALAPLGYAIEGIYVAHSPAQRVGPFVILWIGSAMAAILSIPVAILTDGIVMPNDTLGFPEFAIAWSGLVSVLAYAGYIVLLRHTGPVFGAQVSYIVTGTGIVWAMLLLGERYSPWVWGALCLLFVGLFLVQPRRSRKRAEQAVSDLEAANDRL